LPQDLLKTLRRLSSGLSTARDQINKIDSLLGVPDSKKEIVTHLKAGIGALAAVKL
jgi:hypothetical protein